MAQRHNFSSPDSSNTTTPREIKPLDQVREASSEACRWSPNADQ